MEFAVNGCLSLNTKQMVQQRHKTRLVAKGYTQTLGTDYQETFALVAKMSSIRILLSLVVYLDWSLYQFVVKNTFFALEFGGRSIHGPSSWF